VTGAISTFTLEGELEDKYEEKIECLEEEMKARVEWERLRPTIKDELSTHELLMAEKLKNLISAVKVNSEKVEHNTEIIKAGLVQQRSFLAETARLWVRLEDWMKTGEPPKPDDR